ncbi:glutathione S-transferase N-terminal domain-containing protein [Serratia odorifera]|jgi:GSH-dependent disulfide-bond oxidoreductase|uniref:Glutathione S-transferase, C-terminal domain protein n=2 Tax=Serratia odorifera TaxID=618 RepID=D4E8W7_SEROD|nr:glutathione S-transferase N-terminal domain-containing protein [Serratia odorifera]EFE93733.1 glutathione S-transferase, C-terminal domain protein [Serratia odorifera DSM 4582]MBJ2064089.1 glutathione S-transferase N-terminal domain-containing protein [Serratia odorifera]PNK88649.1 glutathione S-transferase [Serratia odorifera]RII69556.1 glutathione S-transferase [Serratia odorifera]VDZ65280.1 GST-like protein yfcG [Serratia odorifera]
MFDPNQFPITTRWPAQHPERLQLYSLPTPNGVKVSIMLEEIGLPYEAHLIDIGNNETWTPEFLTLNPNGKIPAILDPAGPDGKPLALFESGAILLYLAEKCGQLLSDHPVQRIETLQWVFFQMAAVGPMFGQLGFFHKFAGREYEDKRPLQRYQKESKRLLGVLETRLAGREWIMGNEYSIADISLLGWVRNLIGFYEARELVEFDSFPQVAAWLARGLARPAVQRGLLIPARD